MTESAPTRHYQRSLPITAIYVDPFFANLYPKNKDVIASLTTSMKQRGFDPHRPLDLWRDARGRGKHTVVEGHQRLAAAQKAGLPEVYVAYRDFADRVEALLWANEQQGNRRNVSREAQCLSLLKTLLELPEYAGATTKELVALSKYAPATIDRARQLLKHGTEAEILEVVEGKHGLREAYDLMNKRRRKSKRAEDRPIQRQVKKAPPVLTALRNDLAKAIDGGKIEVPEMLRHATALYRWLEGHAPGLADDDDDDDEDLG